MMEDAEDVVIPSNDLAVRQLANALENLRVQGEHCQVPQQAPLDRRQVRNNAGGFVYKVTDEIRVRRFLIIGSSGGSYYAGEQELTIDNVKALIQIIEKGRADIILRQLLEVSRDGRAAKQQPTIFALALCAKYQPDDYKQKLKSELDDQQRRRYEYVDRMHHAAYQMLPHVCRISTHLFLFVKYSELIAAATVKQNPAQPNRKSSGWSRAHRRAIAEWYLTCDPDKLVMQITKYRNREGWTHRDLLRLAHPNAETKPEHSAAFAYIIRGIDGLRKRKADDENAAPASAPKIKKVYSFLEAVDSLANCTEVAQSEQAVALIREHRLCREQVPATLLNEHNVWRALINQDMPLTALIRNLGKMTNLEILTEQAPETDRVVQLLDDKAKLKAARIHPFNVLTAMITYGQGHGFKGKLDWTPVPKIKSALERAFYATFSLVQPTNQRWLLALDVSGSMDAAISNSCVSCAQAAAAMSLVTINTEPHTDLLAFTCEVEYHGQGPEAAAVDNPDLGLTVIPVEAYKGLTSGAMERLVAKAGELTMGATDCALPMLWATKHEKEVDVFVVYTDSETWHGKVHPTQALRDYRRAMNRPDARLIVVGMTATKFTIADPHDPRMLDVVGFDSAAPTVMAQFAAGNL